MSHPDLIEVLPGLNYSHNRRHRDGTALKSQWTIDCAEERICFTNSHSNRWFVDDTGWGLHFFNRIIDYLGVSHNRQRRLFIAKFVANSNPSYWHGYPADYQVNIQDIPNEEVLSKWLNNNVFRPAQIRKISRGKPCMP